ncbi:hypothetical protein [Gulosibacter hominis]|uniref:hypothetical protein n=1 Tax=Gulosibacter hominis TaxID=2770504 RepID=UPI0019194418|nr:hypothetical protein [Gulosibacter hominis]
MLKEALERTMIGDLAGVARAIDWESLDLLAAGRKACERDSINRDREVTAFKDI